MTRTIYEAYNSTTIVQFLQESDALAYAQANNMQVRTIDQEYEEPVEQPRELSPKDWLNLEQGLYQNMNVLSKAANSSGNGFTFFLKVITDGKTTGASENALQLAINMLIPTMAVPFNQEEKNYINQQLEVNGFSTRL